MKKLLLLPLLVSNLHAMELIPVSSPNSVRLLTNHKHMYVEDEDAAYRVENHNMNRELREALQRKALSKYKEAAFIRAHKQQDGKYTLYGKVRGNGGTGPITAFIVGMGVRVGCYTGYLLGATTPVVIGTLTTGPAGGMAAGTAVGVALASAGGAAGVIAATETIAMKATLATLLCPIPLP